MDRIDIIGTVVSKDNQEWKLREGNKQPVFVNMNKQLQYSVRPLIQLGQKDHPIKFFTGYINNLLEYGFNEKFQDIPYDRQEIFKDDIKDYLFIFNPLEFGEYMRVDNVAIIMKPSFYKEGMLFESTPFYVTKGGFKEFLAEWRIKKDIEAPLGINTTKKVSFIVVYCMDTKEFYAVGSKDNIVHHKGRLYYRESLCVYRLHSDYVSQMIINPRGEYQSLCFIESEVYYNIISDLNENGDVNKVEEKIASIIEDIRQDKYIIHSNNYIDSSISESYIEVEDIDSKIINTLEAIIGRSGFTYGKKELINFHTALKTRGLVVLEGMSGTGKSRLVDFYRQAIGLDDKHYKCISVKSSWTDESDLFGYPDMMNNLYRPDHEGVIDLLVEAQTRPKELYLLCFDEMNLARVEHYFSQFLSVLEMEQNQQVIRLYNDNLKLQNGDQYPSKVNLNGNILFVGTINKDESTHHFSDKVLDRANVIRLGVGSLKDLYKTKINISSEISIQSLSTNEYFEVINDGTLNVLSDKELDVLEKVHTMLINAQYDRGIGYRIVKQIEEYMRSLPKSQSILTRREAFDLQLTQRVLSKLRGDRMNLEEVLVKESSNSIPLIKCLDDFKDVSDFEISKKVILQKAKALECYGYTI